MFEAVGLKFSSDTISAHKDFYRLIIFDDKWDSNFKEIDVNFVANKIQKMRLDVISILKQSAWTKGISRWKKLNKSHRWNPLKISDTKSLDGTF